MMHTSAYWGGVTGGLNRQDAESNHYSALCLLASQPNWTYLIVWSVELVSKAFASAIPASPPSLLLEMLQKAKAGRERIDDAHVRTLRMGSRSRDNNHYSALCSLMDPCQQFFYRRTYFSVTTLQSAPASWSPTPMFFPTPSPKRFQPKSTVVLAGSLK